MRAFLWGTILGAVLGLAAGLASEHGRRAPAASPIPDTLIVRERQLDTVFLRDTIRLTRWRTQFDTLTDSVEVWKHDTLRVVEYVRVADSTVAACTDALATCEAQKANLRAQRDTARAAFDREHAKPKASLKRDAAFAGAGAALVAILQAVFGGR